MTGLFMQDGQVLIGITDRATTAQKGKQNKCAGSNE